MTPTFSISSRRCRVMREIVEACQGGPQTYEALMHITGSSRKSLHVLCGRLRQRGLIRPLRLQSGGALRMIPTEHAEQVTFVQWMRITHPQLRLLAIPNGGQRHRAVAAKMKAEGVAAGVPDIYIPALRLWIEMKRQRGGTVSQEQKDWIEYLRGIGDTVVVARGADEALAAVEAALAVQ